MKVNADASMSSELLPEMEPKRAEDLRGLRPGVGGEEQRFALGHGKRLDLGVAEELRDR